MWKEFTQDLIQYLDSNYKNIVFLAWGKDAHNICLNIDPKNHHIITSSHPSPYSYNNSYTGFSYGKQNNFKDRTRITYPSFKSVDHFGRINTYLKSVNKTQIFWDVIDI